MTFKEFHILNENNKDAEPIIKDYIKNIDKNIDLNEIFKKTDDGVVWADKAKEKYQDIVEKLEKIIKSNNYKPAKKDIVLTKSVFGNRFKELKDLKEDLGTVDDSDTEHNNPNPSNGDDSNPNPNPSNGDDSSKPIEKNVAQEIDDFLNKQNYTPNINSVPYSKLQINSSNFKTFDALKILYSAINTFKIKKEWVRGENSKILYIIEALSKAAGNDKKLSQDEYANALISQSERFDLAREPNILKFILFLTKLKTANVQLPSNSVYYIGSGDLKADFDKNSPVNVDKKQEEKDLAYVFFNYAYNKPTPKDNEYGSTLRNLANFVKGITFELDSVLDNKTKTVFDINNFVKEESKEVEKKEPEKEGLASRVRGQYLSKRITDNKRNLDRYDRETEKLKDDDSYSKLSDYNQAGKVADKETYGFNIDKPTADEDSINNFEERITHLFQKDLLDITGALRIKGIAGERSEANRKNNAISRTWEEAIMRSNNKILIEGFFDSRLKDTKYALRDIKNKALKNFTDDNKAEDTPDSNGEYTSNAENRANDIFKDYMQRGKDIIGRYVKKMHDASRKVEAGKTYAQRVNKEWSITKAYYDLLRKLFDLKLACRDACEEGGLTKIKNKIGKFTERFTGDKEYREKNAISNADAVKKMLEKQLLNVQSENDNQTIAKLYLYSILFNSKSASDAINSINNGNFSGLGLDNVKDYTNVTTSGIRVDLLKPSKIYNKPADLFRSVGINPKEITEDGLTQLQKSLNKEECLAKVNEFKNFFGNVKSKITPAASISFEELFRKNGFVIKEESQEVINARNLVANELKNGIDLTDIVKKINLAEHSIKTAAFKQAIAGNVLLNGFENSEKVYKLFNAEQFVKVKSEQLKYKQAIEKDQQMQQNNVQQPQQINQQVNNNQTDDKSDLENAKDYAGAPKSVVTTNAVDSTYGNGYQKQTPQSRMKEIIYKKGNYTVKTRQMI